ncbi:hypothetical protein OIU34_21840 [Pararhizobium sp. BT-229]|uniref:hypothetical protein n=1 Tax=Pararhizobium sp. BT-229 TaxID=2986923 RepID=UPI0021F7640A|nr:hypothetical protein [Pararhizobium sp. BT-229]MCV9964536.1 hypothetical protein [Pararhizobium sp. BT-229]
MHIEDDRILNVLRELETEKMDLLIKIEMYSSHITHATRPEAEQDADAEAALLSMYDQIGVVMPGAIRKRFEDVRAFNRSIASNRKKLIAGQVEGYVERLGAARQRLLALRSLKHEAMAMLGREGEVRSADVAAAEARLVERPSAL